MSLGDDVSAMQQHKDNGTLAEFMAGTGPRLNAPDPWPHDRSATMDAGKTPPITWLSARGD